MDPETKELLKQNIELAQENNQMLKKIIHSQKMATIYRIVYWSIIILSTFGAYYFIQPYLSSLLNVYTGGGSPESTGMNFNEIIKNFSNKEQFQDLINTMRQ